MATDTWAAVQWTSYPSKQDPSSGTAAWHKQRVPYMSRANALQTLDVWIPRPRDSETTTPQPPSATSLPAQKGLWIIYIHGGAWRDPSITASSFAATVNHLLAHLATSKASVPQIGGLASLSYSLSMHPSHPSDPSPPADASQPRDPSREAVHPTHILDVLTGLAFLQDKAGFGDDYILVGHSCGATLALQAAMDSARWATSARPAPATFSKPKAVVGLNGLYDLPALIADAGPTHKHLAQLYEGFVRLAFGDDFAAWRDVSPAAVGDWAAEWRNGAVVVVAQSRDDSLVPYRQTEGMLAALKKSGAKTLQVREVDVTGDHNDVWAHGERLAQILMDLARELAS